MLFHQSSVKHIDGLIGREVDVASGCDVHLGMRTEVRNPVAIRTLKRLLCFRRTLTINMHLFIEMRLIRHLTHTVRTRHVMYGNAFGVA